MSSEATESAWLYDLLAWADTNKRSLIAAAVVLLVGGLSVSVYVWHRNQREALGYAALLELDSSGTTGQTALAPSAAAYLKVAHDYAGTAAAEQALLLAAGEAFESGNYTQAKGQFAEFLKDHGESALAPAAVLGVAACLDALNRIDEALKAYQDVVSRYPTWPNVGEAKLAMARLYEAKSQPQQAMKIYEDLMAATPRTAWSAQAEVRHAALLRRRPGLAAGLPAAAPALGLPAGLPGSGTGAGSNAAPGAGAKPSSAPAAGRGGGNHPAGSPGQR